MQKAMAVSWIAVVPWVGRGASPGMMRLMSMNRAALCAVICSVSLFGNAVGQQPAPKPAGAPQAAEISGLVKSMIDAELALTSLRMTMTTTGKLPGGLDVVTQGELRVLRKTQADPAPQLFSQLQYSFGDGMRGRLATSQTPEGITMFEEDPAFGAVFLRIAPKIVTDLEWASGVLKKSDLPGMTDSRAQSPLGSGMVRDLSRIFDLAVAADKLLGEHQGTWLRGARKAGLDAQDPDLPLADRVEVFVRGRDHALLIARFFVGENVVQELKVDRLELGAKLGAEDFTVDGHGERIRSVQEYAPMWEQIVEAIAKAERKAKKLSPGNQKREDEQNRLDELKKEAARKEEARKEAARKEAAKKEADKKKNGGK